jgi:Domain of unknown function (DUF4394)
MTSYPSSLKSVAAPVGVAIALAGCAGMMQPAQPPQTVFAVIGTDTLVSFSSGAPGTTKSIGKVSGLGAGESIVAIDFRPANRALYALTSAGRLYTLDTATGAATRVGTADAGAQLKGVEFGLDFNPTVDRVRVVGNTGENMRLHPDTGAVVDSNPNQEGVQIDGPLAYAATDTNNGRKSYITSAAYTNSVADAKTTTNFVIDSNLGILATQGTREGAANPVSPNTGQLFTVGSLGVKTTSAVAFDISPKGNVALAAITPPGGKPRLYAINLATGAATSLGAIGSGEGVRGIAIAP